MASRKIEDLCPRLQKIALDFKEACADIGIDVLIYCTYRGEEEQNQAFAEGKSKLKYPHSKHNAVDENGKPASKAFDCVPYKNGQAQWNDAASYAKMGALAPEFGLEWGGNWKMRDKPHFQLKED